MDPITIVTSVITMGQAIGRLRVLVSGIKAYFDAPEEFENLMNEVTDLKQVMSKLQSTAADLPLQESDILTKKVDSYSTILSKIDDLVCKVLPSSAAEEESRRRQVNRVTWVRKRNKIERLMEKLTRANLPLLLHINSLQFFIISQLTQSSSHLDVHTVATILPDSGALAAFPSAKHGGGDVCPGPMTVDDLPATQNANSHLAQAAPDGPGNKIESDLLDSNCECVCHYQTLVEKSYWKGFLGSLFIRAVGQPFVSCECSKSTCRNRPMSSISIVYYCPRWLTAGALRLAFLYAPRPSFALSFPRIVPPDAEIAICIRDGNCDRTKQLLLMGEASPADIIAPYGHTTLSLAMYYRQTELCRLLVAANAPQTLPTCLETNDDIERFWINRTVMGYSIPAAVIVTDIINLVSTDRHFETLPHSQSGPISPDDSFTRLHKAVLDITREPISEVLRMSRASIDDTDSLGRTALHYAVCRANVVLTEQILGCGANPDIRDCDGKTALLLSVIYGSKECADTLLAAGAKLGVGDYIGCTPIHVAAIRGDICIMELLLDAGADLESLDFFGETPLMEAALANKCTAITLLRDRGANIDRQDRSWGFTALHRAVLVNAHDVLELLLREPKARSDILPKDGKTILHFAAENADGRTMDMLISANRSYGDSEDLDEKGYTAREYFSKRKDRDTLGESFLGTA